MNIKLLLIALCFTACAQSQTQLQHQLTRYEGRPVEVMIARLGPPSQQTEVGGERWVIWTASEQTFALGYWMGYEGDSTYQARCEVSARVEGDVVRQVRREGNLEDCEWLGLL